MRAHGRRHRPTSGAPIGTLASYGPDKWTTTKIVAGIASDTGEQPVLRKWFGAGIANDPQVLHEAVTFFREHGVREVVATLEPMGCPHEEEVDFPLGGDCPQCPYWSGVPGSGTDDELPVRLTRVPLDRLLSAGFGRPGGHGSLN